jgi:putative GTP pyrophosphokinase
MIIHSKSKVNKAGEILKDRTAYDEIKVWQAEDVLTHWRYRHIPILNTFQANLRQKLAGKYERNGFVAQRLKRSTSIIAKLQKQRNMKLSTMQDIAGVRAVLFNVKDVNDIYAKFNRSKASHILVDTDNYIETPKDSGYRSIHLVFVDISLYSLPLISDDSLPGIQSKVYHFVCRLI